MVATTIPQPPALSIIFTVDGSEANAKTLSKRDPFTPYLCFCHMATGMAQFAWRYIQVAGEHDSDTTIE